jgi:ferredoxin
MKVAICYYSSTGNTQLSCQYIASKIDAAQFDLLNIIDTPAPDLSTYDLVGFASSTYFMGIPHLVVDFIQGLPDQHGVPAFVLNTYGMMSGQALKLLARQVSAKGFRVIAGHSFFTPESYPPFIVKGWGNEDAPGEDEITKLDQFITQLAAHLEVIRSGQTIPPAKIKIGLLNSLMRPGSLAKARKQIGQLQVDLALCEGCATCTESCPYGAIQFNGQPVFEVHKCHACWTCFNRCPQQAIFTDTIRSEGHYPQPNAQFVAKLNI